ncbi:hypothetical protein [Nonomuraea sp. NPDC046570]
MVQAGGIDDVCAAADRLAGHLSITPLLASPTLDRKQKRRGLSIAA